MPNIIPPLLSSTPPPIVDDDDEDEFGDFRAGVDLSFSCDGLSLPPTPEHVQKTRLSDEPLDYNSNNEEQLKIQEKGLEKDFQDIRKPVVNPNTYHNATNGFVAASEIKTDTESAANEIKTTDKHSVLIESENVAADETNFSQGVDNVFNTLNVEQRDLCNSENNLNGVNSESEALEIKEEALAVKETSTAENGRENDDCESHEDLKENLDTKLEDFDDDFGGFKDFVKAKEEKREPFDFDGFSNNLNGNEIHCDNEKSLEKTEVEENNCDDDDFGDFSAPFESFNSWKTTPALANEECGDFEEKTPADLPERVDDFGAFEKCPTKTDDTDDFGDFESNKFSLEVGNCKTEEEDFGDFQSTKNSAVDDSFGDFENCPVETNDFGDFEKSSFASGKTEDEDEFGDFDSCSTTNNVTIDEFFKSGEKAEEIITAAFPKIEVEEKDFLHKEISEEKDVVFGLLKDIMETNALKFQWVNSISQKVLLKSLNIDIRNILYGPGWNLNVPKFAANLATNPLKPEILTPEVVPTVKSVQQSESVASFPAEVPSVQFDWSSAGLTNPLDSQNDEQPPSANINLDWHFLEATKTDESTTASPAHSLNFEINPDAVSLKSDSEFEPPEEEIPRKEVTMMVPLRETHIFAENPPENAVEDDFGDFHMSLPATEDVKSEKQGQCLPAEPLKPVVVHAIATATVQVPAKIEWPEPGLTEDDIHTIELSYVKPQQKEVEVKAETSRNSAETKKSSVEEEDWTDFLSHKETSKTSPGKKQNNLQLSVLNLGQIQPIKPPVPVITPQGLLQTKIASGGTVSPLTGSPAHAQRKQLTARPPDGYQPSIISQQFSRQFPDSQNFGFSHSVFVPNASCPRNSSGCDDDEDWTEFVSSQPAPQQQIFTFTPNIIANPNRFQLSYGGKTVQKKSSVPSVAATAAKTADLLPDLEFVTVKSRTFSAKK